MDGWAGDSRAARAQVAERIAPGNCLVLVYGDGFDADHGRDWSGSGLANDGRTSKYFFNYLRHCFERQSFARAVGDSCWNSCATVVQGKKS